MFDAKNRIPDLLLPNGCVLRPGGRVRISSLQVGRIPQRDIDDRRLVLDETAHTPGSEVICWPIPDVVDTRLGAFRGCRTLLAIYAVAALVIAALYGLIRHFR